ncbi:uncharacterized protein LOC135398769 isoform X2 [Ornithodoros turicata]
MTNSKVTCMSVLVLLVVVGFDGSGTYGRQQVEVGQPPPHGTNDDDEYYVEDNGEKEYYYYDQDEYYEYFQDRKPVSKLRGGRRRLNAPSEEVRKLFQNAMLECNETELMRYKHMCDKKLIAAKQYRDMVHPKAKGKPPWRKICRLVSAYTACVSDILPNRDCPDLALRIRTESAHGVHLEGFHFCGSAVATRATQTTILSLALLFIKSCLY